MDFELDFDPSQYSKLPPNLDLASTVALARKLIAAAPVVPSPGAKQSLQILVQTTQPLESGMVDTLRGGSVASKRPLDLLADRSWSAIEKRLGAWMDLPAEQHPEVEAAAELHAMLFPDGLRFTQLEYGAQWAEAESRIQLLKQDHHERMLEQLCGKAFVAELYRCHEAYGAIVGTTAKKAKKAQPEERPDLNLLRKKTQQAILAHQIQLVAMAISTDPSERAAGRAALRPIDEYREKLTPSRPKKEEPPPADGERPAGG